MCTHIPISLSRESNRLFETIHTQSEAISVVANVGYNNDKFQTKIKHSPVAFVSLRERIY